MDGDSGVREKCLAFRCVLWLVRLLRSVIAYTVLEQKKEVWVRLEDGI